MMGGLSLPAALLTVVLVLVLAYWCSRLLGKNWANAASGRNMKIIDQIQLGQDKRIILLKLGEHTYLIGVSQAGIQLLLETGEMFEEEDVQAQIKGSSFKDMMDRYMDIHRKKGGDR
ncbi:flagellar biosynthetic protein FliO [Hungatella hathewayi]|uniref:flagellar biosynthetic protein FliO n=1 Tax=Hungatella hathewayi TaxID=154046 RepID=UPI003566D777